MGIVRGVLGGTLALTALQTVVGTDQATGRVTGLMGDANRLLGSFLDANVPAIPDLRGRGARATPLPVSVERGGGGFGGGGRGGGWGGAPPARSGDDNRTPTGGLGVAAITWARKQLGTPYVWGGDGLEEGGFDCSGLTKAAWAAAGVTLPRTSKEQARAARPVPKGKELPGDLVFYGSSLATVHHVALYLGAGLQLSAPKRGDVVKIQRAFHSDFLFTGRPY